MSNANEPAFPVTDFSGPHGMSKRDLIAMHALQGWIASNSAMMDQPEHHRVAARFAVNSADSLLAELSKAVPQ
jgi:hypothetical protein